MSEKPIPATWQEDVEWTEQRHLESLAATIAAGLVAIIGLDRDDYLTPARVSKVANYSLELAEAIVNNNRA